MIKTKTTAKKSTTKKALTTSAPKKTAEKKTSPVAQKATPAPKKTAPKKSPSILRNEDKTSQKATKDNGKVAAKAVVQVAPKEAPVEVKKSVPAKKTQPKKSPISPKIDTHDSKIESANTSKEGVKLLGILHLAGNLLSAGSLGLILVILYYFVQKNKLSTLEKETCFEIINFNLSFIIYAFIAAVLMIILIGFLLIPIVLLTWLILMIVGFLKHISGENYKYPFIIRFVS